MSHTSGDTNNHKLEEGFWLSNRWGEDNLVSSELIRGNLLEIEGNIAHCKPRIIGVTKYFGRNAIIKGYEAGLRDFGESRVNESVEKINSLSTEIRNNSSFHFIGHLQTNKVEKVVRNFDYVHSIDSLKLAQKVSKAACSLCKKMRVLLQVNNANEIQKYGYDKEQLRSEFGEIINLNGIEVIGLMNMAPFGASDDVLRMLLEIYDCSEMRLNKLIKSI